MTDKNRTNCLKASTIGLFLLFFQTSFAQKNFTAVTQELDKRAAALGGDFVVLIGGKDTVLYQKEGGAMKVKTVAPIASASGWLTAALVLQLVDEGKVSLEDKVAQYLPVFEKYGKNYITLRHCLSHLTGIDEKSGKLSRLLDRKKYNTLDEEVSAFAAQEIETNPGTAFSYSNMGLSIAGRVAEVVLKKRFDLLIKQKLLTPLGMRQTTFTTLDGSAPNPATGARSTALDYMGFLKMLLNGGKHNGQQILSEAAIAELRTIQTASLPMNNVPKESTGLPYALGGWALEQSGTRATALAYPGLTGTWPAVDFCRGYTFLVLPKAMLRDEKAELYGGLKKLADGSFGSGCTPIP